MIRILTVSPNRLASDLLKTALGSEPDLQVVGSTTDESKALRESSNYDIALVHAALAGEGAQKLTHYLGKSPDAPRVVIVGIGEDEAGLQYLEAGAAGCVRSTADMREMVEAIRMVARRQVALPPGMASLVMARVADLAEMCRRLGGQLDRSFNERALTRREREILRLMAKGYGNREIARQLTIEIGTAKNHVHNILDKLCVSSRRDAAACWSLAANQL